MYLNIYYGHDLRPDFSTTYKEGPAAQNSTKGDVDVNDAKKLRSLETENSRLKRMVADLMILKLFKK